MSVRRSTAIAATVFLLIIGTVAAVAVRRGLPGTSQAAAKATYYCPMHPTYTADRPGDCPICNMRLVKREEPAMGRGAEDTGQAASQQAICYLHNCPRLHEGRPCPMTVVAKPGERVTCPVCGTHVAEASTPPADRRVLYWTDPMIPGFKADRPGQSPMGMALVPVYAEDASTPPATSAQGYAPVLLSPQRQQLIGVTTSPVARRTITKSIRTVGRIAYDPELYQAQAEYLEAVKAMQHAEAVALPELSAQSRQLVESSRLRLRLLGFNDALIAELEALGVADQSLLLADPIGQVWLYASVYEFELPLVRAGSTITVDVPSIPGKTLTGVVRAIDPVLDATTRSARLRAILTDPERVLRPEMFVNVTLAITVSDVVTIPEEAVFHTGTATLVFVDQGRGLFEPREVTLGVAAEGAVEVKAGVVEGESVVTSGNFLIDSESRLKAALEGMRGGGHQHGQ